MTAAPTYTQDHVDHDGQHLGIHRYPTRPGDATALLLPAMGVPAGYYRPFAQHLTEHGVTLAIADLRGTGTSTPPADRAQRYGYPELAADIAVVLKRLAGHFGDRPPALIGHSLGGHLASLYAAAGTGPAVRSVSLIACGIPYHRLYGGRAAGVRAFASGLRLASRAIGHWPGTGFAGRQTTGVIRDWAYAVRTGRLIGGGPGEAADLARLDLPVDVVAVEGDRLTPDATTDLLCARLENARLTRGRYTVEEAGGQLGHFAWVRAGEPLAKRVAAFVAEAE